MTEKTLTLTEAEWKEPISIRDYLDELAKQPKVPIDENPKKHSIEITLTETQWKQLRELRCYLTSLAITPHAPIDGHPGKYLIEVNRSQLLYHSNNLVNMLPITFLLSDDELKMIKNYAKYLEDIVCIEDKSQ